jgi:nucleoside-diphosphate-sugar epimerase
VFGADIKDYEYGSPFTNFFKKDLAVFDNMKFVLNESVKYCNQNRLEFAYIFQYAADMGGAGYIFTGLNDTNILLNSAAINLNLISSLTSDQKKEFGEVKIFYSSSACIYPEFNQMDTLNPNCHEDSAYPANPDSEYGWEKIFSERLYFAAARNFGLNVRVARFHNIYGPFGTFQGGREKSPAALCRIVAIAKDGDEIEIWGDGNQTRSFLYIDDCLEATLLLMDSDFIGPVNIGSTEMVSINELFEKIKIISGKNISKKHR